jgi:hypothetical protein
VPTLLHQEKSYVVRQEKFNLQTTMGGGVGEAEGAERLSKTAMAARLCASFTDCMPSSRDQNSAPFMTIVAWKSGSWSGPSQVCSYTTRAHHRCWHRFRSRDLVHFCVICRLDTANRLLRHRKEVQGEIGVRFMCALCVSTSPSPYSPVSALGFDVGVHLASASHVSCLVKREGREAEVYQGIMWMSQQV